MRRIVIASIAFTLAACTDDSPFAPIDDKSTLYSEERAMASNDHLRVMTRNVYVGANVDIVLAASNPQEVPFLVAQAFQQLLATDFPERARALALEISRAKPHLVGLQEISTIRLQSPGDAILGGTVPAEDVVFDYLEILMAALEARGERYRVVARIQNPDVEIPMVTEVVNGYPTAFDDVRLTDYDVILARHDVETTAVVEKNFDVRLPVPTLGIEIPRGYVAATARVGDESYRFVNTHLEPASIPDILPIQLAQANELIQTFASEPLPVILVGDLNTHAPAGDTYQMLVGSSYLDAWTQQPRRREGYTCCHADDLRNDDVNFDRRIDLIMTRPPSDAFSFRAPLARVVGDHVHERTSSGLWASDHGGVWAGLRLER